MNLDQLPSLAVLAPVALEDWLVQLFLIEKAERNRVRELELQPLLEQILRNGENAFLGIPGADDGAVSALGNSLHAHSDLRQ